EDLTCNVLSLFLQSIALAKPGFHFGWAGRFLTSCIRRPAPATRAVRRASRRAASTFCVRLFRDFDIDYPCRDGTSPPLWHGSKTAKPQRHEACPRAGRKPDPGAKRAFASLRGTFLPAVPAGHGVHPRKIDCRASWRPYAVAPGRASHLPKGCPRSGAPTH